VFTDDDFEPPRPQFQVSEADLWVSTGDRILRLDLKTGKQKSEVPIRDRVREVEFTDASIMVIAGDQAGQKSITHIALPSGTTTTEALTGPARSRTPTRSAGNARHGWAARLRRPCRDRRRRDRRPSAGHEGVSARGSQRDSVQERGSRKAPRRGSGDEGGAS